jgi:hypothetical protein
MTINEATKKISDKFYEGSEEGITKQDLDIFISDQIKEVMFEGQETFKKVAEETKRERDCAEEKLKTILEIIKK